jgi:hypothetical protein
MNKDVYKAVERRRRKALAMIDEVFSVLMTLVGSLRKAVVA